MMVLNTPLNEKICRKLRAGDEALLSGIIYTARDAAHKRLIKHYEVHGSFPLPIENQLIYYAGPTPSTPWRQVGSIGPTTSARMDNLSQILLENGLKGMIGKGERSDKLRAWIKQYGAIYFVTIGGAGSYLAKRVESMDLVMYEDLGPEAIYRLKVTNFPLFVAYDCLGGSIFQ